MLKSIALIALATVALVSGQDFTISTPPSLVQCQPVLLSWSGGTAPYILDVIPGGQTGAAALENLQNGVSGTSYSWTVNLASGTSVTLKITDSKGMIQYSSPLTIQAGSSSSCLNSTATSAAGSAGVTGMSVSASGASGSMASGSASATSMMSSAAASSSAAKSSSASMTSMSASMTSGNAASSASSAAATTSGAAYKKYEVPAAILAAVGGIAALL